ncbi:MAG: ketoacyl-ACP synthase III [Defluviitaleaceae bacterium]|nr:ketoacyl-ACP synthase III [Defluviitaleaceae bacterium]
MNRQVIIKSTGLHHPDKSVDNEFFVEHFAEWDETLGKRVEGLLAHTGRSRRYLCTDPNETVLTMAKAAALPALESAGLSATDIDGIVFSTDTPEYLVPSNACMLREILGATNAHVLYDVNANCAGMVVATDVARAQMQANKRLKRVLVAGVALLQRCGVNSNAITYATLGDAACAVILEVVEGNEDNPAGIIDSVSETDTEFIQSILYPKCGLTKANLPGTAGSEKHFIWEAFDTTNAENCASRMITQVLTDNGHTIDDVAKVFLTQFSNASRRAVSSISGIPLEKFEYVGDVYGYTGTSSVFLAYHHAVADKKLTPGDLVVFCGVGAGLLISAMLYKEANSR